jgi:hypothetical protein
MEARVKYFSMNGNRRALIVIIVSFFASDCIQVASNKKTGGKGEEQICFDGQKNSHVSAFPPPFHHAIKEIYNQDILPIFPPIQKTLPPCVACNVVKNTIHPLIPSYLGEQSVH